MSITAVAPPEPSAWMRARIALCTQAAKTMGLDPQNGPHTIVWPLGATGKPGSRADRSCDRRDYYVSAGELLTPIVTVVAPRMILAGALCTGCLKREVVPA